LLNDQLMDIFGKPRIWTIYQLQYSLSIYHQITTLLRIKVFQNCVERIPYRSNVTKANIVIYASNFVVF